jgi:hypothetical protein
MRPRVQGTSCIIVCDWQCFHLQQHMASYPFHVIACTKTLLSHLAAGR